MSTAVEPSKSGVLPASLDSLKSPRDILSLGADDLHTLLTVANQEMEVVEAMIGKAEAALELADAKERESVAVKRGTKVAGIEDNKNGIGGLLWIFKTAPIGCSCALISGIVAWYFSVATPGSLVVYAFGVLAFMGLMYGLLVEQRAYRKKLNREADVIFAEAKQVYAEADAAIEAARASRLIPKDYRYTLALSTMLKSVENGRANTWTEAADKYELQLHQWELEKNSDEMLEYQKFIALATEQTAKSAGAAATFSGISAVVNIARLFR